MKVFPILLVLGVFTLVNSCMTLGSPQIEDPISISEDQDYEFLVKGIVVGATQYVDGKETFKVTKEGMVLARLDFSVKNKSDQVRSNISINTLEIVSIDENGELSIATAAREIGYFSRPSKIEAGSELSVSLIYIVPEGHRMVAISIARNHFRKFANIENAQAVAYEKFINIMKTTEVLFTLCKSGSWENSKRLMDDSGLKYSAKLRNGYSILINSILYGNVNVVNGIYGSENPPSLDIMTPVQYSEAGLLHIAALSGSPDMVDLFIKKGISINVEDKFGKSVLGYAVESGSLALVKYLVEKGLDPKKSRIKNAMGSIALSVYANNIKMFEISNFLKDIENRKE